MSNLNGHLSLILLGEDLHNEKDLSAALELLIEMGISYEVLIVINEDIEKFKMVSNYSKLHPNIAVYLVKAKNIDGLVTVGLELALGNWILLLPKIKNARKKIEMLIQMQTERKGESGSYVLIPQKQFLRDLILAKLFEMAIGGKIQSVLNSSSLHSRESLEMWNSRNLRSKVVRVVHLLHPDNCSYLKSEIEERSIGHRIFRIGIRSLLYITARPLRWASALSICGALLGVSFSIYILFAKLSGPVVSGWASTNMLISILSTFILMSLSLILEYLYQIISNNIDQRENRIVNETLSGNYSFKEASNTFEDSLKGTE
jgi:hypothetical protein